MVEVRPSPLPPVRYKGQVWIRRGARQAIANEAEERILSERRTSGWRPFDAQPCRGATLSDLSMELFTQIYRPNAVATDVIEENHRPLTHQLASLRLFDLAADCPTNGGVLLLGKDVLSWLPHAYVQYVRMDGVSMADEPVLEKQFVGDLFTVSRGLNDFLTLLVAERPVRHNLLQERMVSAYPEVALRELLMNAILHRSYEMPAPVRFLEFTDRIEIQNPGPLFGPSNERNFPAQTSYRNPTVAEALKNLGFINGFGRGVIRAQ